MFPTTVMAAPNSVGKYQRYVMTSNALHYCICFSYLLSLPEFCTSHDIFYNSTKSSLTQVTFNKFGFCQKFYHPRHEEEAHLDEDVDEEDSINFLDEGAEVKCYDPPGSRPCPEGRIPYTCAAGGEMCCEWSDLGNVQTRKRNKNQRLKDRINLPGYGSCTRDDIPTAGSEDQIMIS